MASATTTRTADVLPVAGARFYKCALQVNPAHYGATFRGQPAEGSAIDHAQAVVARAIDLGVEVLAVTDHNSVRGIVPFRAAASGRGVVVVPGFELTTSEGVHVLCLYPPDTELDRLERYLGEFGIHDTNPSTDLANKPFAEVLRTVRQQAGISIAAHVTGDHGLFKALSGQARIRAWRDENLLAIQIPATVAELTQDVRQIVQNRNLDYRRPQAAAPEQAVAALNARDVVQPDDLARPSATCWIKMDEVSIDGLRQAFLDPDSRIRLNDDDLGFEPEAHMELTSLTWEGGFLDGVEVGLNPNLNVLIGGRGTGKSTVVESIRSVLGLAPVGEEARKAHEGIVRHVLRNGTKISLAVRVQRPGYREYRVEQTIPNPPIVREADGGVLHRGPQDLLPQVEVYGQHEISELAKSPGKLIRLLDRFVGRDDSLAHRKESLALELAKNRRSLCDAQAEIRSAEEQLAALPSMEETLVRFQEVGLEDRLHERSLLVREERLLASIPGRVANLHEALELLQRELPIDLAFLSERALADLPGREILSDSVSVLEELGREIEDVAGQLEAALTRADQGIDRVRVAWDVRRQSVQADYERILRELQKSRVDGEEFIRLRGRIEALRPVQERLVVLRRLVAEHEDHRRTLLAEWEDIKAAEYRTLGQAGRTVSKKLEGRVQVEVTPGGDREPLFDLLRKKVGGRLSETLDSLRNRPDLSLPHFVSACRSGSEALARAYGIVPRQAERLATGDAEVLMQVEELDLAATTAIRLNTAPAGEPPAWQALEDLSKGQKATAVLLLLLLESGAPLIVDQPEDDLDNRFITEGVVPRMREGKERRQFIFSTHNANIPVLGDAELILGLSAAGEAADGRAQVLPGHSGSIDAPGVRPLVEEILEGGRSAFETRRRKYGF